MRSTISFICSAVYFVGFIFNLMGCKGEADFELDISLNRTPPLTASLSVPIGFPRKSRIENNDPLPAGTRAAVRLRVRYGYLAAPFKVTR
jgi:hypothetical protein